MYIWTPKCLSLVGLHPLLALPLFHGVWVSNMIREIESQSGSRKAFYSSSIWSQTCEYSTYNSEDFNCANVHCIIDCMQFSISPPNINACCMPFMACICMFVQGVHCPEKNCLNYSSPTLSSVLCRRCAISLIVACIRLVRPVVGGWGGGRGGGLGGVQYR